MARLVSGLQGFFQAPQANAVEPEGVGGLVQARALFQGDDAVFDDLGEDLLVVGLELAERDVPRELSLLEAVCMFERVLFCRHSTPPC